MKLPDHLTKFIRHAPENVVLNHIFMVLTFVTQLHTHAGVFNKQVHQSGLHPVLIMVGSVPTQVQYYYNTCKTRRGIILDNLFYMHIPCFICKHALFLML